MESERNEEVGTAENQKEMTYNGIEIPNLHIVIQDIQIKNILELHDLNSGNAGLDALWVSIRRVVTEKILDRFGVDLT